MRFVAAALAVLVASGVLLPGQGVAQSTVGPEVDAEDSPGDVVLRIGAQSQPVIAGYEDLDFVRLWVGEETLDEISLGFKVVNFAPTSRESRQLLNSPSHTIQFTRATVQYQVVYNEYLPCAVNAVRLETAPLGPQTEWHFAACLPAKIDRAVGEFRVTVEKRLLVDSSGVAPQLGDTITDLVAHSAEDYNETVLTDRVPDSGTEGPYTFIFGQSGNSPVQLSSPSPVRFSNGESTSVVFPVRLRNANAGDDAFLFSTHQLPKDWHVRVPERVGVTAGAAVDVPFVVTVPFSHVHGATESFVLRAEGTRDSTVFGELTLGIYFPEIPQPAGHHPTLYLHSKPPPNPDAYQTTLGSNRVLWMNPLDDDPDPSADDGPAAQEGTDSETDPGSGVRRLYIWNYALNPGLRVGLDFDTGLRASFRTQLSAPVPAQDVRTRVSLWYCNPLDQDGLSAGAFGCPHGSWHRIGNASAAPISLSTNAPVALAMDFAINGSFDVLPRIEDANLRLEFTASIPFTGGGGTYQAVLHDHPQGSELLLPLIDYHDPLDRTFEDIGNLRILSSDPSEKEANPGRASVFVFDVNNGDSASARVSMQVDGLNNEWATWTIPTEFELGPGQTRKAVLEVRVPEDANEGERAELFAIAQDSENPAVVALKRVRVVTVTSRDIPDESGLAMQDSNRSGSSGLPIVGLGLLVTVIAIRLRRTT